MVLLIVLILLTGLVIWLLLTPLIIRLDSRSNLYQLLWRGIVFIQITPVKEDLSIQLKLPFWKREYSFFDLLTKKQTRKKTTKSQKPRNRGARNNPRKPISVILRMLGSFKFKVFNLNLDTSNYIYNAYLYPIFYWLKGTRRQLQVNYQGKTEFHIEIENNLARLLWAFFIK